MERPPQKSILFCPTCGHESPSDGDWRVRSDAYGERLDCPDCGVTITVRNRSALAA